MSLSELVLADASEIAEAAFLAYQEGMRSERQTWAVVADAMLPFIDQAVAAERLALTEQIKALPRTQLDEYPATDFVELDDVLALVEGAAPTSEQPDA